jgi:hypothetical protein
LFFDNLVVVVGILKRMPKGSCSQDTLPEAFSQGSSVKRLFSDSRLSGFGRKAVAGTQREYVTALDGVGALAGDDPGLSSAQQALGP